MKDMIEEIKQEKKVLKQLTDMREKYIKEELQNGNVNVRDEVGQLGRLDSPSAAQAIRMMNKKVSLNKTAQQRLRKHTQDQAQLSDRDLEMMRRQQPNLENRNPNKHRYLHNR